MPPAAKETEMRVGTTPPPHAISANPSSFLYALLAEAATQAAPHQRARSTKVVVPPELMHGDLRWALIHMDHLRGRRRLRTGNDVCGTVAAYVLSCLLPRAFRGPIHVQ